MDVLQQGCPTSDSNDVESLHFGFKQAEIFQLAVMITNDNWLFQFMGPCQCA